MQKRDSRQTEKQHSEDKLPDESKLMRKSIETSPSFHNCFQRWLVSLGMKMAAKEENQRKLRQSKKVSLVGKGKCFDNCLSYLIHFDLLSQIHTCLFYSIHSDLLRKIHAMGKWEPDISSNHIYLLSMKVNLNYTKKQY